MYSTILFDMDGVLVDTEDLNLDVSIEVCNDLGIELSNEEKEGCIGVTSSKFYHELFERRELGFEVNQILNKHFKIYEKHLMKGVVEFAGAREVPRKLKDRNYELGLVSGSTKKQIDIILSQLDLLNIFRVIISADDISHSKPEPEGYLKAAALLEVRPKDCLVLEDSKPGIQAAKAAGVSVAGIVNNGGLDLSEADFVVKDLTEIFMYLPK